MPQDPGNPGDLGWPIKGSRLPGDYEPPSGGGGPGPPPPPGGGGPPWEDQTQRLLRPTRAGTPYAMQRKRRLMAKMRARAIPTAPRPSATASLGPAPPPDFEELRQIPAYARGTPRRIPAYAFGTALPSRPPGGGIFDSRLGRSIYDAVQAGQGGFGEYGNAFDPNSVYSKIPGWDDLVNPAGNRTMYRALYDQGISEGGYAARRAANQARNYGLDDLPFGVQAMQAERDALSGTSRALMDARARSIAENAGRRFEVGNSQLGFLRDAYLENKRSAAAKAAAKAGRQTGVSIPGVGGFSW